MELNFNLISIYFVLQLIIVLRNQNQHWQLRSLKKSQNQSRKLPLLTTLSFHYLQPGSWLYKNIWKRTINVSGMIKTMHITDVNNANCPERPDSRLFIKSSSIVEEETYLTGLCESDTVEHTKENLADISSSRAQWWG